MLEYIPALNMYRSTTPPPMPAELRAWIDNPYTMPQDPAFLLVLIVNADRKENRVTVQEIGTKYKFNVTFDRVHCVHNYLARKNKVTWIYGDPKPC
jgi:hypothetical protein